MRAVLQVISMIVGALLVALFIQVLIAQSREPGDFGERIAKVAMRQLGLERTQPAVAASADTRSDDSASTPSAAPIDSVRLGDMTAADLQELLRDATREELDQLQRELSQEADRREASGFWTDVRLNALFLFLGAVAPMVFRRGAPSAPRS
jgi:hypothetical protein